MGLPQLILSLEGEKIPADQFVDATKSFFGLLNQVATAMSGKNSSVKWSVSVEKGSVVLAAEPMDYQPAAPIRKIVGRVSAGLRELEQKADRPRFFNDDALNHAKTLAQVTSNKRVTSASVRVRRDASDTKPIRLSRTPVHVDDILGPKYRDYGTMEGTLETISVHGGTHFSLYEAMTGQAVRCVIDDLMLDMAWEFLRNRRRVAVSGFITYQRSGRPSKIEADYIQQIGGRNIPATEVYGILSR